MKRRYIYFSQIGRVEGSKTFGVSIMGQGETTKTRAEELFERVKVSKFEIQLMRSQLLNLLLDYLQRLTNYWHFLYKNLISIGVEIKYDTSHKIEDNTVFWILRLDIPDELIEYLARLKKVRMFKIPKQHPLTKQKLREMIEKSEEVKNLLEEIKKDMEI